MQYITHMGLNFLQRGTTKLLGIRTLRVGSEHKCGPPALCADSMNPSTPMSVDKSVYIEVFDDAL